MKVELVIRPFSNTVFISLQFYCNHLLFDFAFVLKLFTGSLLYQNAAQCKKHVVGLMNFMF